MNAVFFNSVLFASLFLFFSPKRFTWFLLLVLSLSITAITSFWAIRAFSVDTPDVIRFAVILDYKLYFIVDKLSAFFILTINFTVLTALFYAKGYLKPYDSKKNKTEFALHYFSFFWLQASMLAVVMLRNAVGFLTFWELMSLSSFVLVIFESDKKENLKTGLNYLIQMHIGFVFILSAFLISYVNSNSEFGFDGLESYFVEYQPILLFVLFFIGFAIKAGFIPFHTWLPYAHPSAPSHISGVMSGVMIKMGIYGILRVLTYIDYQLEFIGIFILSFSLVSGIFGIMMAAFQHDYKKLLAYCSIENIGIIGIGIGTGVLGLAYHLPILANLGFAGALLHILNHSLFKSLLFFSVGNIYSQTHSRNIEFLGGLGKKMPVTSVLFLLGALAISGLPPFNGFISEFLIYSGLFQSLLSGDLTSVTIILIVFTTMAIIGGLSIFSFTKLYGVIFLGSPRSDHVDHSKEVGKNMLIPGFAILFMILFIGFAPALFLYPLSQIVAQFTNTTAYIGEMRPILNQISLIFGIFIVMVGILWFLRKRYFKKHPSGIDATWGCGYTGANPATHQYTSSSYSNSLSHVAYSFVSRKKKYQTIPKDEIFPAPRNFISKTTDVIEEYFINRPIRKLMLILEKSAVFQTGKIQHYLLYALLFMIFIFIIGLLNLI
jgi:formate hydrogenlyase subunit 3/multisubunit Na+/H+ antiporter MnhD subunit